MKFRAVEYLFPKLNQRQKLPLLSKEFSSSFSPGGEIPQEVHEILEVLQMAGVGRTLQDAYRIYCRYPGQPVRVILRKEVRKRKRENKIRRALRRFRKLFR